MTAEGRELRDALASATSANAQLSQAISKAGAVQAGTAMVRAWQLKAPKRDWRSGEDVVPLIEPCKVFPELSARAANLLAEAPISSVGPGIVPLLYAQLWARPILDSWIENGALDARVKAAIQRAKKVGR